MSQLIPTVDHVGPDPERVVAAALATANDTEHWTVFHAFGGGERGRDVVVAPGHGVLVIEAVSSTRIEDAGFDRWRLGEERGAHNPFDLAAWATNAIVDRLESRGLHAVGYPVWHAVWLTRMLRHEVPVVLGSQPWELLDRSDLADPAQAVRRVLAEAGAHLENSHAGTHHAPAQPSQEHAARMVLALEPHFVPSAAPRSSQLALA